jgi:hypothetical protein
MRSYAVRFPRSRRTARVGEERAWADRVSPPRVAVAIAAIGACLPYLVLKVMWLAGTSVGSATATGAAELHDSRHTVGNVATLAMELLAVLLVVAFTHPRGLELPATILVFPMWVASGLLAPIALSVPVGIVAQAIVGGSSSPSGNGLQGWVYVLVYGGFIVQAAALLAAFVLYARIRWGSLFRLRCAQPAASRTQAVPRRLAVTGAAAAVVYAVANLAWALGGAPLGAPPDFETLTQRCLLAGTGVLAATGAWAVLALAARRPLGRSPDRLPAPLVVAWLGSATCFASGIAQHALAGSTPRAVTSVLLALGTLGGLTLAATSLLAVTKEADGATPPARPRATPRPVDATARHSHAL